MRRTGRRPGRAERNAGHAPDARARAPRTGTYAVYLSAPAPTSITSRRRSGRSRRAASSTLRIRRTRRRRARARCNCSTNTSRMMTSLTGLDVTNASLYDGASALAEAVLMAVRLHKSARRACWSRARRRSGLARGHAQPSFAIRAYAGRVYRTTPRPGHGHRVHSSRSGKADSAALVVPQAELLRRAGRRRCPDRLGARARLLVIAVVNPTALAVLKPPGAWGRHGADIAVGEGQPLGMPLASGGPYFGFMACRPNTCGRCRAASSAARSTSKASPDTR